MTYDEALLRLLNHANLPDSHTEMLLRDASFIFVLDKVDQERILVDFKPLFEDIIACLEVVNFNHCHLKTRIISWRSLVSFSGSNDLNVRIRLAETR